MRVGNICFSDEFFSTTATIREIKQNLEDELVRRLLEPPSQPNSRLHARVRSATFASLLSPQRHRSEKVRRNPCPLVSPRQHSHQPHRVAAKKTYSGKCGGRNDDLVITLQLAITG